MVVSLVPRNQHPTSLLSKARSKHRFEYPIARTMRLVAVKGTLFKRGLKMRIQRKLFPVLDNTSLERMEISTTISPRKSPPARTSSVEPLLG